MPPVISAGLAYLASWCQSRHAMQLEILALRHQIAVYQHSVKRPQLQPSDRLLWAWLSRLWSGWQQVLAFVQPRTVIAWQKKRFRDYWWKAFLHNHVPDLVSCDFFTVPTVTFKVLFVFIILAHDRRRIVHFNATEHATATWTAQQIVEAFPWDAVPRYLLRDRDDIYGEHFQWRIKNMGIEDVKITPQSPWQNPYAERVIGSIRRECLDDVIVLNERHLRRMLHSYGDYYHTWRVHRSLEMDAPEPRAMHPPELGSVRKLPEVGGLHHHYERRAA